jgi:hypothetical protein
MRGHTHTCNIKEHAMQPKCLRVDKQCSSLSLRLLHSSFCDIPFKKKKGVKGNVGNTHKKKEKKRTRGTPFQCCEGRGFFTHNRMGVCVYVCMCLSVCAFVR